MPLKGEFFLACRYLKPQKSLITLLTYISLLGPVLGVTVLIVVTSIMNGMPSQLIEAVKNSTPHVVIESKTPFADADEIMDHLKSKYDILSSPVTPLKVFLQKDKNIHPFLAKGIYPFKDQSYSILKNIFGQIVKKDYKLKPDEIILGTSTAMNYNLQIGDVVTLHSPAKYKAMLKSQKSGSMKRFNVSSSKTFKIVGYYSVRQRRFDQSLIIMHQDTANELLSLDWGQALNIEMKLQEPDAAPDIITQFEGDPLLKNFEFTSWQDAYDGFYKRVKQEKLQMTFVSFLIMLAAGVAIGACIFSLIIQKTKDIGILKATGVTPGSIILIFMGQGFFIGILGTGLGFILGLTVLKYRAAIASFLGRYYEGMSLLQQVPVLQDPTDIRLILWGSVSICLLSALIPAIIAASINPVKALQSGN
ncbi:MAG: ABC transporter permease [Lentisphaerales bacterium]|nr:ABC transporter permease [Lentisphaerales bacterium]